MGPVAKTRVGMTAVAIGTVRWQVITTGQGGAVPGTGIVAIPGAAPVAGPGPAAVRRAAGVRSGRRGAIATTTRVADPGRTAAIDLPAAATTAARGGAAATTAAGTGRGAGATARGA